MTNTATTSPIKPFDYKQTAEAVLRSLRRDRDRQIIARRFGFNLAKRQTLEQIGRDFGITRERVRQIEKATLIKIGGTSSPEIKQANNLFKDYLEHEGGVCLTSIIAEKLGATNPGRQAYIVFLASLASDIEVIDEDDSLRASLGLLPDFSAQKVKSLAANMVRAAKSIGHPATLKQINSALESPLPTQTTENLAKISKNLANHEDQWGLIDWPEVNPKSIRDKTYLVMNKHGQPLHFGQIADRIRNSNFSRRNVTVQAVHNELIKDGRFVLIGRGIYALAEWGYTPGTVADIIIDILKQEAPLHKDEIVRRVLKKRQVKTTTIVLNLQEKDQFERVAKATYKLKQPSSRE